MAGASGASGSALTDQLFGTRTYTEGARFQVPRKIPLRIEPKTYFALERTYLAWMHMAVLMGGITSALVGFSMEEDDAPAGKSVRRVGKRTTQAVALLLLPVSLLMIGYALFVYYFRSKNLERKQYGFFDDRLGPVTLCVLIMLSLTAIMGVAISDYVHSH